MHKGQGPKEENNMQQNKINASLNEMLASLEIFYHKLQSFHWYVTGHAFFTIHAQLESYYEEVNDEIDEVAEALLKVGGKPVSRLGEFKELSKIQEDSGTYISADELMEKVLEDYRTLLGLATALKTMADEDKSYLVSSEMDDLIASFSKAVWMISQSMMK